MQSSKLLPPILGFLLLLFCLESFSATNEASLRFEVTLKQGLVATPQTGRLLVILNQKESPEPRFAINDGSVIIGRDADDFVSSQKLLLDHSTISCPIPNPSELPTGDYFVQALLMVNQDLRLPNAPGDLYSSVAKVHIDHAISNTVCLQLSQQIGPEQLPADTELVKFVQIQSALLSKFHGRPIYLRAGIILPRNFNRKPSETYPLWVRVGGLDTRYTAVHSMMGEKSDFQKTWLADGTPQMIMLQLDGAGPYGDCYQINSDNNGPYGDAITQELIPYVERHFRGIGKSRARVLSGASTGGWASLALQIFYPDFFNGVWSSSPDGVDFRAFELIDIYSDTNAYVNKFGFERPSERTLQGDTKLIMRREVLMENVLGRGNSWTLSGGQWCAWNAAYGPRGADGQPIPLWDPQTGKLNHEVAEKWKSHDLNLILHKNWKALAPKLQGKIHIAVGDADNYFLNNGVHLMDSFLSHADPAYRGRIVYGPVKGHTWSDVSMREMMNEMKAATEK
ncbi:putative esterase [Pedosphaera parvula Ellin514]|uniref:Putative esterase n=1 Tax=Pedosphaera parvula (strain Ellin514) TaxID=320771 RepID=B9XIF1_PEDPL|nr:putative esterase [Pedosphaera parvula Ellin514]